MNENEKLIKVLETLNINIEILSKITALSFRKNQLFKGTETKPEQIEILDEIRLPDEMIALIIGSTTESVKKQRRTRKAEIKKLEPQKTEG